MTYIGSQPATSFETVQKQISTSNSGTTITLDRAVTSVQDILLTIDAVVQSYDNYSVSGTTLTVGGTLSNNRVEILYVGRTMQSVDPTDSSVSTAKIQNDAVTKDKVDFVTDSGGASLEAKGSSGYDGAVRLNCSVNSHYTELKSASHGSYSGNLSFTLPSSTGTNGQVLQTNGSGVLSFVDAPSGGLQFIQQQTVSSNTTVINFNDAFSSTYDNYLFLFDATMGTNAAQLEMRFRSGSPTNDNYTGANTYRYGYSGGDSTGGSVSQSSNNNNKWVMGDGTYAAVNIDPPGVHGFIHFNSHIATNTQRTWSGTIVCYNNNDEQRAFSGGGRVVNNTVMTGFGFTASSGDINQFNGRLYGVVNS